MEIPNIFTPNSDGFHDHWIIYGSSATIKEIKIWDWNNVLVFHKTNLQLNDPFTSWDGTFNGEVVSGRYSYEIEFESFDHVSYKTKGRVCSFACDPENDNYRFDILRCN